MADPVAKPAKPSAPPADAPGAGQPATPKPVASIDDLIERAEDRLIPKGSTVRVSPANADVVSKARQDELQDSLAACGIKLIWDKSIANGAIIVESKSK